MLESKSALISSTSKQKTKLFAQFGGQGVSYLAELRSLYLDSLQLDADCKISTSVSALIEKADSILEDQSNSLEARLLGFYKEPIQLLQWIKDEESIPSDEYLASAPISMPLIFLTQVCQYFHSAKKLFPNSTNPVELFRQVWMGATGHSQGIVAASLIATASDDTSFFETSMKLLVYQFWLGARLQQVYNSYGTFHFEESENSPMLSINGLAFEVLYKVVERVNKTLHQNDQVTIALVNGVRNFVCSGKEDSLKVLLTSLQSVQAKPEEDQSRVPFSKRKYEFRTSFLPISLPFHCPIMKPAVSLLMGDLQRLQLSDFMKRSDLKLPLRSTVDGNDLATKSESSLLEELATLQAVQPVNWPKCIQNSTNGVTHVIDFGPGITGLLTTRIKEGQGVQVIQANLEQSSFSQLLPKKYLFSPDIEPVFALDYKNFLPKLSRTSTGEIFIDNKFSRVMGKAPIMIAGMTPTTANEKIVIAFTNAGYHGELAGGGQATPEIFRNRIHNILNELKPGESIHVNSLYLNPKLWNFQFAMSVEMRSQGLPIDSITIGAGVPSLEKANEIVKSMQQCGMTAIGFKPGSVNAIRQVIEIAQKNPTMNILMQWTGGRAGGHHSFEDAHDPILQTYRDIRMCPNIVLIMGSGIGESKDALKYLKGTWSQTLNHTIMPFDGVLMGSRVMSCLEASTSEKAKELLVKTPGVTEEKEWEKSYEGSIGGVITVISELGEPIHVVANRGTLLWKELDTKYFTLAPQKLPGELEKNKDYIIKRINSDYQKLYFGIQSKDHKITHLDSMTYHQISERLVELMFIDGSWVHDTYKKRLVAFLQRIEERFHLKSSSPNTFKSMLTSDLLERINLEPSVVITSVFQKFPQAASQIISPEDVDFFIHICKNLGKPVNFIPVIDKELSFWFKKDSLWYSEALQVVPQQDPQRVMILQSPVTVKSIVKANEPIGELLANMEKEIISDLLQGTKPENIPSKTSEKTWFSTLLNAPHIIHFKNRRDNYFKRILARDDIRVEEVTSKDSLEKVIVYEMNSSKPTLLFESTTENKEIIIRVTFMHRRGSEDVPLTVSYSLFPNKTYSPVHLRSSPSDFNNLIKRFYAKLWLSDPSIDLSKLTAKDTIVTTKKIHLNEVDRFCRSIGRPEISTESNRIAPIDYTVVIAWEALSCGLFVKEIDADLLDLLHLSYGYKILGTPEDSCLTEGEIITVKMKVTEIVNLTNGKRVTVFGTLHKSENSSPIIEINSQFFFRGQYASVDGNFQIKKIHRLVEIKDKKTLAAIASRSWLNFGENSLEIGDKVVLEVTQNRRGISHDERSFLTLETTGNIYRMGELTLDKHEKLGEVLYKSERRMTKDPVENFLERYGRSVDNVHIFENGGYSLSENIELKAVSAMESEVYGESSGDVNPIHYNSNIAFLAGLESTIVHGMWTAARARNLVDTVLNRGGDRKKSYEVKSCSIQFVDKIPQLEKLTAKIVHTGVKNGLKMLDVEIKNEKQSTVLKCAVEATQSNTAFMFTGQGSAEIGMGMDLYATSTVAKQIWDRAEKHMLENYGFSLLEIIRKNPKEVTINFRSENGRKIREKYTSLKHKVKQENKEVIVQLFHDIRDTTDKYTFTHPQGLLFQTQFQQPALTLVEKASFEDMKARGLVPVDAMFAGHSLGEYSAISSVANVLRIEELVELVFLRGITMQNCVKRNEQGLSPFGMIAVNTQRVGSFFTPKDLHSLVDLISKTSGLLLQVVNYNVENWQYIVTGYNSNLETLRSALNFIKENPSRLEEILNVVTSSLAKYPDPNNVFNLTQGVATVPLAGIDVPFHSQYLLPEVPQFRNYLLKTLDPKRVDIKLLEGKYVPNLTPTPFEVSMNYVEDIIKVTSGASLLKDLLQSRKFDLEKNEDKQLLGYFILVELLAFQFASPVRWIETQDVFLKKDVRKFIEIGPSTTLAGMAKRTLQLGTKFPQVFPPREVLSYKSDRDTIYYNVMQSLAPVKSTKSNPKKTKEEPKKEEVKKLPEAPVVSAPVASTNSDRVTSDTPSLNSLDVIKSLLTIKLKKKLDEIQNESTIKDLVGGKSAIQNEIIGDFQKEFGSEPEGAATMSLTQLSQQFSGYKNLGSISNSLISKMIGTKMAPGFGMGEIKDFLYKEHGLDTHQADAVIVHGLTMEPESRLDEFKSKEWLSTVSQSFATVKGKHLAVRSKMGSTGSKVQVVDSEALNAFQRRLDQFVRHELENSANFLNEDLKKDYYRAETSETIRRNLEQELKSIGDELGAPFRDGIRPQFDVRKVRKYNSYWAWGRQEAASLFYDTIRTNPANYDIQYCEKVYSLTNRGTPELLHIVEQFGLKAGELGNQRVARHINNLAIQVSEHMKLPSYFRIMGGPHTAPITQISPEGRILYKEIGRENARNFGEFLTEMQRGYALPVKSKRSKVRSEKAPVRRRVPYLFCRPGRSEDPTDFDPNVTRLYFQSLEQMGGLGLTFHNKVVLITGCGKGSIGFEIIKGLLQGGATVICTTSRPEKSTFEVFQKVYEEFGGKNSMLYVVPFNAASLQDVNHLIEYVYDTLNIRDIDFLIPFAAISENGRDVSGIDSVSELAHRMMLTNVIRMIGKVKSVKESKRLQATPTIVILPLSPNHGVFGSDGLYSESKASLEILFNKVESEGWKDYIGLIGAVIGWTRGTGLMEGNNMVASEVEKLGLRTFSQKEMAIAILGLMGDSISQAAMNVPIWADLTGGMKMVNNLNSIVAQIRADFMEKAEIIRTAYSENEIEKSLILERESATSTLTPRANFESFAFPTLPSDSQLKSLPKLEGMIDLDKTVVVVGFGEIGPWGNRRTRWEIEHLGEFSMEGCIELAHIMGLIQYHNGVLPTGQNYTGWIDATTKSPVRDIDVKEIYEQVILKKCGIREIEPHLMEGYNPHSKNFLHEVALTQEMPPMEVFSEQESEQYKLLHGDKVNVFSQAGKFYIQFKKGATLYIPRAMKFDRFVAGQIPSTWEASRYGIPPEIINQVDRVTLFNLVSTCEALISSGIVDPYELYEYVHISEVGNTTGSGIGGLNSIRRTFRERFIEKSIQSDILQETFINVIPAWINMLIFGSAGPIKIPVGACATSAISVELGVDTIKSGKAKFVIVGGCDDISEESSYEFGMMKATNNSEDDMKDGRTPSEMSRPATESRHGFIESHGSGTQILTTAELALKMGLPIYAIVGLTNTSSDTIGRSVPAPGRGILTTARESKSAFNSPLLDLEFRREQLISEIQRIENWAKEQSEKNSNPEFQQFISQQTEKQKKIAKSTWSNDFYVNETSISPLKGALGVWGLTIDDLGVVSMHGTSTQANDKNESEVIQMQMAHLGRTKGNILFTILQKYLTGHPKGAAAAWMMNGLIQSLLSGIVPGNKNADNIDQQLEKNDFLVWTNKSVHTVGLKAGLLKSFGFGQASAEILVIHPDYLYSSLSREELANYTAKRSIREKKAISHEWKIMTDKENLVKVKSEASYNNADESRVFLDPLARAQKTSDGIWKFNSSQPAPAEISKKIPTPEAPKKESSENVTTSAKSLEVMMKQFAESMRGGQDKGIGVDVQLVNEVNMTDNNFMSRNFTENEILYCMEACSDLARKDRLAGRFAAKEAILKAITTSIGDREKHRNPIWSGSGSGLKDIEVLPTEVGAPVVKLRGHVENVAKTLGIQDVKVTISHSGDYAVAQAVVK